MISFFIHKNILINIFISWHYWIKDVLNDEIEEKYNSLIDDENRTAKANFFESLYDDEFLKLNVKHLFMLKAKDDFQHQVVDKVNFLALIKPIMAKKVRILFRKPSISPPHEMAVHN